jgi:hypothetical protein
MAFASIAAIPLAVRSNTPGADATYALRNVTEKNKTLSYVFKLIHNGITGFATAKPSEKLLEVQIITLLDKTTGATKTVTTFYDITKVTKNTNSSGNYSLEAKFNEKLSGDSKPADTLGKSLLINCTTFSVLNILKKNNEVLLSLKYESGNTRTTTDDDADCFLTTACVHHKGLADNCDELQTLRWLRDNYMARNEHGIDLLQAYKTEGPRILKAMREFDNRNEILDYLHDHLVQPSVQLIKAGHLQEATDYYEAFTAAMMNKYLS